MKCAACETEVSAEAAFCPRCGAQLAAGKKEAGGESPAAGKLRYGLTAATRSPSEDVEAEIWTGTFSPRAMLGSWVTAGLVSVAAIVLAVLFATDATTWGLVLAGMAVLWLATGLVLAYRRMSLRYRLTNQRLFHEHGLFSRVIDRIEVIRMDDISFRQGFFERMFGVGTIFIKSSDRSDPDFAIRGIDQVRDVAAKIESVRRAEQVKRSVRIDQV